MVELALPKNSRVEDGKVWTKIATDTPAPARELKIYRWSPDDDRNPRVDTYTVNTDDCGPMVLDALIWIKSNIDPTLT
ncbi:MAG: succinate dehydrogenase iron-sulfur subunit, partial [Pseudomonadota bacterium]